MRRFLAHYGLLVFATILSVSALAQQTSTTVTGNVKSSKSKETVSAVSVSVKGGTTGTYTDDKGNFKLTTTQKLPFTLVFSSVGYADKELSVATNNSVLNVTIETSFTLGNEVVVSASRVPERILESPVSIERIGAAAIRNTPATSYYDMLTNLKGVDIVAASLTFKSVGTRGFNSSGNTRLNQIVDGMDNQAPGLNFSVGNIVGLTELDVESMELLPGASSALYGPGGMNGTVLINSKNPFKYQGLSFQIKQGVNHLDSYQRPISPFYDWSVRWANKINDKLAYKIGAQFVQAQDWLANQSENYSGGTNRFYSGSLSVIPGWRESDPNYNGVNVYGDETTQNLSLISRSVTGGIPGNAAISAASNAFLAASPTARLAQYNAFLTSIGAGAVVAGGGSMFFYGQSPSRNYFRNQDVSRTGWDEKNVVDPTTVNFKLSGALHYQLTDKIEASFLLNWGTGNTVYTGSDRYSLKDFKMGQYKLELKAKNWFVRAYTTLENSGSSYNATITTRTFNEALRPSGAWYPQYIGALVNALDAGLPTSNAHNAARGFADQGLPIGQNINLHPTFQKIAGTPIFQGGGLFVDASSLIAFEGQYNLTQDLNLAKHGTDILIGANSRQYVLNSQGTIFADTAGNIKINEVGSYIQISQKLFNDVLKITASGRYDKSTNFKGRFTPRASAVVRLAKDHNLRFSYQNAYRFPTTQNQWINLLVGGGTRLMGGLPQLRDYYKFNTNPVFTLGSVQAFGQSVLAGAPNPTLLKQQAFDNDYRPESSTSFEVGYKGLIANKLLIDVYAYWAGYKDFLSSVQVIQSKNNTVFNPADLLNTATSIDYNISVNAPGTVKTSGWGISADYLLGRNYSVTGNFYHDEIGTLAPGFISFFNTPKYRSNFAFNNTGFGKDSRYGFSIVYRWANTFYYEGTFANGMVPWIRTIDAMVSYKLPSTKSLIKIGGTNIFNKYYRTAFGNPAIGALYYVSFGWNVF